MKLCQDGIPGFMDFVAIMRGNYVGEQVETGVKFSMSFFFIEPGKPTITSNVSVEDGRELVFHLPVSNTPGKSRLASVLQTIYLKY